MIRHIALVKLTPETTPTDIESIVQALSTLRIEGIRRLTAGPDLGLREGNLGLAIVTDLEDEAAYLAYDSNPDHDRIRSELILPFAERVERCQFRI